MGAKPKKNRLTVLAKELRNKSTDAERLIWYHLRARRFGRLRFRRQQPIGEYVVDFACMERRLVIELDGGQHVAGEAYDRVRDQWLAKQGFKVLRYWNNDVLKNTEAVLADLYEQVGLSPSP